MKPKIAKILCFTLSLCLFLTINITVIKFTAAADDFQFSTYFGSSADESQDDVNDLGKMSLAVDKDDNIIIVGRTHSADFPVTLSIPSLFYGDTEVFVSKFNSNGSTLLFSTVLAGSGKDWCTDVDTDSEGNIYLVGTTTSNDFYQNNSEQPTNLGGGGYNNDAWVAKITSTGVIEWCRYFGGSGDDWGYSLGVDSAQNVYITGSTYSIDLELLKSGDYHKGGVDCYLTKFNSSGHTKFSTLIGSTENDAGIDIQIDSEDNIVVGASTGSLNFPTLNAYYDVVEMTDGAILKYDNTGELLFSTIVGGSGVDRIYGIALDESDDIYFAGYGTGSSLDDSSLVTLDYTDYQFTFYEDIFAGKLSKNGQELEYMTVFGGDRDDLGLGIDIDEDGNAYIVGETLSSDFPFNSTSFDQFSAGREAFITVLGDDGKLLTSTPFGGIGDDVCRDVKINSAGSAILYGFTDSSDFPITNPHQNNSTLNGGTDVFLMSVDLDLPLPPPPNPPFPVWWVVGGSAGFIVVLSAVVVGIVIKKKRAAKV